jgi:uncharacterized protein with PhoU and TrkA domain
MKRYIGKIIKTGLKAKKKYTVIGVVENLYPELKQGGVLLVKRGRKIFEVREAKLIDNKDFLIYTGTFKKTHREPSVPKQKEPQKQTLF